MAVQSGTPVGQTPPGADDTGARRFDWTAPLVMRRSGAGGVPVGLMTSHDDGERRRLENAPPRRKGYRSGAPDNVALPLCAPNVGCGRTGALASCTNDGTKYPTLPATSLWKLPRRGGEGVA